MSGWTKALIDIGTSLIDPALVRAHCRENEVNDGYLTWLVNGAVITVEIDSRLSIRPARWTILLPVGTRSIELPSAPFVSATLTAIHDDDSETALTSQNITHDGGRPGCLSWDAVEVDHSQLRLSYVAGSHPLAADIELLILTLVAHRNEHREAVTADGSPKAVPLGYDHMIRGLDPLRDAVL